MPQTLKSLIANNSEKIESGIQENNLLKEIKVQVTIGEQFEDLNSSWTFETSLNWGAVTFDFTSTL